MPIGANLRHHSALVCLGVGVMVLFASVTAFAVAVAALVRDQRRELGLVIASTVAGVLFAALGVWLIRRGVVIRHRAIEAGSTVHIAPECTGPTSVTETKLPSFLAGHEADRAPVLDANGKPRAAPSSDPTPRTGASPSSGTAR